MTLKCHLPSTSCVQASYITTGTKLCGGDLLRTGVTLTLRQLLKTLWTKLCQNLYLWLSNRCNTRWGLYWLNITCWGFVFAFSLQRLLVGSLFPILRPKCFKLINDSIFVFFRFGWIIPVFAYQSHRLKIIASFCQQPLVSDLVLPGIWILFSLGSHKLSSQSSLYTHHSLCSLLVYAALMPKAFLFFSIFTKFLITNMWMCLFLITVEIISHPSPAWLILPQYWSKFGFN